MNASVKISFVAVSAAQGFIKIRIQKIQKGGVKAMAKCDICGKGKHFGNNVSHSHRRSNHIWNANIKNVKCVVNGTPKHLHVCTTCLKSGAVERA